MTVTLNTKKNRPNYYIVVRYFDEIAGKPRQKWMNTNILVKGNNKREALNKLKEVRDDLERNRVDLSKNELFINYLKEWLELHRHSISSVTYDTYKLVFYNQIIPFFETTQGLRRLRLQDIEPKHILMYMKHKLKSASANTVRKHLWYMSKCFEQAVKMNEVAYNPVKRVDFPKDVKYTDASFYNEKQMSELLAAIKGDVLEDIIKISLFYGLRRSEVIGLKWGAVDFDNNLITIKHTVVQMGTKIHYNNSTKNSSSYRSFVMPPLIKDMFLSILEKHRQLKITCPNDFKNVDYVFIKDDGSLITPNFVTNHFRRLLKWNNLPHIRFHDLRHSAATYLLNLGFSMKDAQMWLGHSDIGTTMDTYVHWDMQAKRVIADSLNERFERMV